MSKPLRKKLKNARTVENYNRILHNALNAKVQPNPKRLPEPPRS